MARSKRDKRVSLADVAREAGVSVATASRVLSSSDYHVSDQLRQSVLDASERLAYGPNNLARAFVAGRSRMIGVLIGGSGDPYYSEIVSGVDERARKAGYLTIVCNTGRRPVRELKYLKMLDNYQAAGVVFASEVLEQDGDSRIADEVDRLMQAGTRVVGLAERSLGPAPLITINNERAMADLTSEMIALGYRRIAYVGGPYGFSTADRRRLGFRKAMSEAKLEPANEYAGDFNCDNGQQVAIRLLRAGSLPDVIICDSDESALGILVSLTGAGVLVPDHVAIAGIDDTREARLMGLTTVSIPTFELAAAAADFICRDVVVEQPQHTILPHRVILRATAGPRGSRSDWHPETLALPLAGAE